MYSEFLDNMVEMAKEAGKVHLTYFRSTQLSINTKSNVFDIVTNADKESEALIIQAILQRYPDHGILGEEGGYTGNKDSEYKWVIDPLDGTTNYSQGLPIFSTSIGLMYRGETIAGVVYAPYLDELFTATRGGGAFMKSHNTPPQQIHVAQKQELNRSVIGTGFPYDKDSHTDNNSENVANIITHVRDLRRMGSAAYDLCCVACGLLDGYWEMSLNLWDVCAGNLIVEEAGGIIYDFRNDRNISEIAGNPTIVGALKKFIR